MAHAGIPAQMERAAVTAARSAPTIGAATQPMEVALTTEEQISRAANEIATDFLLSWTMAAVFNMSPNPSRTADEWLRVAEHAAEKMTFPDLPPEWSDVAAQELRDALARRIHRARVLATGEPFDPDAFRGPSR
jgi:hypothetical protein